jgi:hypothetical protein
VNASLSLELIGDDQYQALRSFERFTEGLGFKTEGGGDPTRPYVAEITGPDPKYKWKREFLRGDKDYSQANSKGSRGVYMHYILEPGRVYEVRCRPSWGRVERYYCQVVEGELHNVTPDEIPELLEQHKDYPRPQPQPAPTPVYEPLEIPVMEIPERKRVRFQDVYAPKEVGEFWVEEELANGNLLRIRPLLGGELRLAWLEDLEVLDA